MAQRFIKRNPRIRDYYNTTAPEIKIVKNYIKKYITENLEDTVKGYWDFVGNYLLQFLGMILDYFGRNTIDIMKVIFFEHIVKMITRIYIYNIIGLFRTGCWLIKGFLNISQNMKSIVCSPATSLI